MTSKQSFSSSDITSQSGYFSALKATVETAFYGENVKQVTTIAQAYALAKTADASFKKPKLAICFTSLGSRVVSCDTLKNHAG